MDISLYIFLGIIIAVVIVILVIKGFKSTKTDKEQFISDLKYLNYEISDTNILDANITAVRDEKKFLIKFIKSEKYAEVSINNKTTFEIKYGGSNDPGKPHPYHKFVPGLNKFMNEPTDYIKVIVIVPKPKKIVRWVNENEIEFVTSSSNVYGAKVIAFDDLSLFK